MYIKSMFFDFMKQYSLSLEMKMGINYKPKIVLMELGFQMILMAAVQTILSWHVNWPEEES